MVGYRSFDLRAYSPDGRIDDMPYGGGAGMVVRVDVVARALEKVYSVPARGKNGAAGRTHGASRTEVDTGLRR